MTHTLRLDIDSEKGEEEADLGVEKHVDVSAEKKRKEKDGILLKLS